MSFADYFYQNTLVPHAVKFSVKDLLQCSEVQLAFGDSDNHLTSHDGALQMGIRVILVAVVGVLTVRLFGREFFQPLFEVAVQAAFVVVDENDALML